MNSLAQLSIALNRVHISTIQYITTTCLSFSLQCCDDSVLLCAGSGDHASEHLPVHTQLGHEQQRCGIHTLHQHPHWSSVHVGTRTCGHAAEEKVPTESSSAHKSKCLGMIGWVVRWVD